MLQGAPSGRVRYRRGTGTEYARGEVGFSRESPLLQCSEILTTLSLLGAATPELAASGVEQERTYPSSSGACFSVCGRQLASTPLPLMLSAPCIASTSLVHTPACLHFRPGRYGSPDFQGPSKARCQRCQTPHQLVRLCSRMQRLTGKQCRSPADVSAAQTGATSNARLDPAPHPALSTSSQHTVHPQKQDS